MSLFSMACKAFQDGCSLSPTSHSSPCHLSATTPTLETHTCQTSVLTNVSFPYNVPHPVGSQDPFCSSHLASVPSPNPVRLSLCLPHHSSGDGVLSFCVYLSIFSIRLGAHEGKAHLRLTHSFTHRMYATCIIVG